MFEENTYVLKNGTKIFVIDPGKGTFEKIETNNRQNLWVLLTHSHIDHIFELSHFAGANLYFNESIDFVTNPATNLSLYFPLKTPDIKKFNLCNIDDLPEYFEVIKTPGHTPGSVCFMYMKKYLFTGDTLFSDSIGRTDLPGGNEKKLFESLRLLKGLLMEYPEMEVFPGHGAPAKAADILMKNIYLKSL
ncbi:hypothetical protein AT15_05020 [Kosmotoga arenicorallina S304]|uniref:Metallo-beta-lactamase domain-containing protein n=2 Tax=Kosmotoga arenicorallina TaxID=688066 RepID=A0A176JVJ8_9BACT|nr:hypothetical protein AT15_05020 [Kosmotoga arenicorallina S304]